MMQNILTVVWDFDPTFIDIGGLDIRWYGLMWAIAILAANWFVSNFCRREGLPASVSESAFLWIVLGTFVGARVGHCVFYEPEVYLPEPWRIITDIRDGGMASHGATIGIMLGIWIFVRRNKLPYVWGLDRIAIVAPLSGAIIRMGNLFNSEIIGRVTDLPWGFKFVRHEISEARHAGLPDPTVAEMPLRHPTQIYEALCYLATFAILAWLYYRRDAGRRCPGLLFGVAMIGIFFTRFLIEFVKIPQEAFEENMTLDMGQWLSMPFILFGIVMIAWSLRRKPVVDIDAVAENASRQLAAKDNNGNKHGKRGK